MEKIIGLTGPARSGKSTVAEFLWRDHDYVRIRFADPLKTMLRSIGLGDYEIEGDGKERPCELLRGQTPRHAMQTLGTEWGRKMIGDDFWIALTERAIKDVLDHGGKVVVEDVRFENEAACLKNLGGFLLRIDRPGINAGTHESESGINKLPRDGRIVNDGSINDLVETALSVIW